MKKIMMAVMVICGCLMMAACNNNVAEEREGFVIKRGTNLSHWLSQSRVVGEERAQRVTEADIARISQLGFDHVRIPIDQSQFWDKEGNKLPEAWDLLTNALDLCRKYNLRALVDLHSISTHSFVAPIFGGKNLLFEDDEAQQALVNLWIELSDVLKDYSTDWVAYEFMNEPVADEDEQWNVVISKIYPVMREREPERTFFFGSNRWQSVSTMKNLRIPEGDKHIILSFHFYEPLAVTHYTARWSDVGNYNGPINYPGVLIQKEDLASYEPEFQEHMAQYTEEWDRERLAGMIKEAVDVAAKYGLQLYCGEWGVYFPTPREVAYNWYRDVLSIFDEYNIAWSTWCYYDEFGFWNLEKQEISDQPLVDILLSGKALGE